jgi:hypothetical protein
VMVENVHSGGVEARSSEPPHDAFGRQFRVSSVQSDLFHGKPKYRRDSLAVNTLDPPLLDDFAHHEDHSDETAMFPMFPHQRLTEVTSCSGKRDSAPGI